MMIINRIASACLLVDRNANTTIHCYHCLFDYMCRRLVLRVICFGLVNQQKKRASSAASSSSTPQKKQKKQEVSE